jgi:TPR repeat protein
MKKSFCIIVGAVFVVGIGFVAIRGVGVRKLSSAEAFNLSSEQLSDLARKARDENDAKAAFRVYQYYTFSYANQDRESNVIRYLRIAATNGNAVAQYNLSVNLILQRDPSRYDEAKFWLGKAAATGNGDAKKGLEDWDHFVRQWQ